jgi:hypothetical protein
MQKTPKLILDTFSEVYHMLRGYADAEFWDLSKHETIPGAVYVIGRQQYINNRERVREMAESGIVQVVMSNPHEGSATLIGQLTHLGLYDLALAQKIMIIGGGDMPSEWPCLQYDKFLPEVLDYEENIQAAAQMDKIYQKENKPYKFLFLNGRGRKHRAELIRKLNAESLLAYSLWTNLDGANGAVQTLPQEYEVQRYQPYIDDGTKRYVKFELFNNEWGEIYLEPSPYIDTYFSLVTETVFEIPYSFRTEKIWKPVVMGHPWIAVANAGFYRDIRNLGFQTYSHVIDESFDSIENNQDRLDRIAKVVADLCKQDLAAFLKECYNTSKYNQQHHREMAVKVRKEFPERFFQFINERSRIPPKSLG